MSDTMNCWRCGEGLTWGGDHDLDDSADWSMVSNLTCSHCGCFVEVYYPREAPSSDGQPDWHKEWEDFGEVYSDE